MTAHAYEMSLCGREESGATTREETLLTMAAAGIHPLVGQRVEENAKLLGRVASADVVPGRGLLLAIETPTGTRMRYATEDMVFLTDGDMGRRNVQRLHEMRQETLALVPKNPPLHMQVLLEPGEWDRHIQRSARRHIAEADETRLRCVRTAVEAPHRRVAEATEHVAEAVTYLADTLGTAMMAEHLMHNENATVGFAYMHAGRGRRG